MRNSSANAWVPLAGAIDMLNGTKSAGKLKIRSKDKSRTRTTDRSPSLVRFPVGLVISIADEHHP